MTVETRIESEFCNIRSENFTGTGYLVHKEKSSNLNFSKKTNGLTKMSMHFNSDKAAVLSETTTEYTETHIYISNTIYTI